jgi:hypothetical protein
MSYSHNTLLSLALLATTVAGAQTPAPFGRTAEPDRLPRSGKYTVTQHQEVERSLEQLADSAHLIVDGTVLASFPATNVNPEIPLSIHTDSRVAVNSVLKGAVPDGKQLFLLTQEGGKVGDLDIEVANSSLVKSGERYLFFLRRSDRTDNSVGLTRYFAIGTWSGMLKVEADRMRIAETSEDNLRARNGASVDDFKVLILDVLNNRVPVPEQDRPEAMMFKPVEDR